MTYTPSKFPPASVLAYRAANIGQQAGNASFPFPVSPTENGIGATGGGTTTLTLTKPGSYFIEVIGEWAFGNLGDTAGTASVSCGGTLGSSLVNIVSTGGADGSVGLDGAGGHGGRAVLRGVVSAVNGSTLTASIGYSGTCSQAGFSVWIAFIPTVANPQ